MNKTSTLQRIDDLEKQVAELIAAAKVTSLLGMSVPKMEQENADIRKNVDDIVQTIQVVAQNTKRMFQEIQQYQQGVSYKIASLEESLISFSKTLAAVYGELTENHGMVNANVSDRLRRMNEAGIQAEVTAKINAGVIKASEVIGDISTVVVAESTISPDGTTKLLSEYNAIDIAANMLNEKEKQAFLGKKVGDVFQIELENNEGMISIAVKEIYDLILGTREGEVPAQPGTSDVQVQLDSSAPDATETKETPTQES